jgi:hypothetical protein
MVNPKEFIGYVIPHLVAFLHGTGSQLRTAPCACARATAHATDRRRDPQILRQHFFLE